MKRTTLLLLAAAVLSGLLTVTAQADPNGPTAPAPVPTHGWVCVTHYDPYVHQCVP